MRNDYEISVDALPNVYDIGIAPEFLAQLSADEARIAIAGMCKTLASIMHTDHGGNGTINSLDIGTVNYLGTWAKRADQTEITRLIELAKSDPLSQQRTTNERISADSARTAAINVELALQTVLGPERITDTTSMHCMIRPSFVAEAEAESSGLFDTDKQIKHVDQLIEQGQDERTVILSIQNGEVVAAFSPAPLKKLVSSFNEDTADYLASHRRSVADPESTIYLSPPTELALPTGFYTFKNAQSKKNPTNKKLAVKIYTGDTDDVIEHSELLGARLIGDYDAKRDIESDYVDRRRELASVADKAATKAAILKVSELTLTKFSNEETAFMVSTGIIRPFTERHLPTAANVQYLVFHKPAQRGSAAKNYITTGIHARAAA